MAQRETARYLVSNPHSTALNVETPTGTGKTIIAGVSYCILRHANRVNRSLIIVPTTEQRRQYVDDFQEQIGLFGESIRGIMSFDGSSRPIRYHRENSADVFVVTIQSVCSDPSSIIDLMSSGSWMVVADEHHHYGEDKAWGDAIRSLSPSFSLAISATPLRGDRRYSIYGEPDIQISLKQSLSNKEIRPIRAHIEHYFIDVSVEDSDEIIRVTTEWLRDRKEQTGEIEDFSKYEIKKGIRYHSKYLSSILPNALACLQEKRIKNPYEHQMIVFCMSCKHAKHVAENLDYMGRFSDISVDWVGSGPNGRKDEENTDVIKRFKNNELDILVQVDKAGEGFNVKRASVLVFLNLIGRSPKAQQQIGRGMRRNFMLTYPDDYCDVFVSYDTEIASLVTDMEEEQKAIGIEPLEQPDLDITVERGIRILSFPKWHVIDVEHDRTEVITPWEIKAAMTRVMENADATEDPIALRSVDDDRLMELIKQALVAQKRAELSIDERIAQGRRKCDGALNILIRNIITITSLGRESYDRTQYGELAKRINWEWNRSHGQKTDSMTEEDFRLKYNWLDSINKELREERDVPAWLRL